MILFFYLLTCITLSSWSVSLHLVFILKLHSISPIVSSLVSVLFLLPISTSLLAQLSCAICFSATIFAASKPFEDHPFCSGNIGNSAQFHSSNIVKCAYSNNCVIEIQINDYIYVLCEIVEVRYCAPAGFFHC